MLFELTQEMAGSFYKPVKYSDLLLGIYCPLTDRYFFIVAVVVIIVILL